MVTQWALGLPLPPTPVPRAQRSAQVFPAAALAVHHALLTATSHN